MYMENEQNESRKNRKAINWTEKRFGILKLSDEVLLEQSQKELGKANSYIQELEDTIRKQKILIEQLSSGENKEVRQQEKRSAIYQDLKAQIKKIRKEKADITMAYHRLLSKLLLLENKDKCA